MQSDPEISGVGVEVSEPSRPVAVMAGFESSDELERTWRLANALYKSGMFRDLSQAEQAFAKILIGRDLGITPTQSLMGIDLVRGNVQLRGVLLAGLLRKHPDYDYKVTARGREPGQEFATVVIQRRFKVPSRIVQRQLVPETGWRDEPEETFTIEDAKRMKLVRADSQWTTIPAVMCVWRALAQAVRFYAPDVLGGIPVYTEADSFEDAPSVTAATGDGSEPGWGDMQPMQIEAVEAVIEARVLNRAAVQMALKGQTFSVIEEWLADHSGAEGSE